MAVVNELVTKFSYQGSTAPIQSFNTSLGGSVKLLGAMVAASAAAAAAISAFTQSTLASLDPMIQLSRTTRVAIEDLQELGFAASVSGSSAEALQASIDGLSEKVGEAAQRGSEDFSRLGISIRDASGQVKSADRVLLEVGRRFRALGLSAEEQRSFAQKLGIDKTLIQLLRTSGFEIDRLRAKARALGVITKEDADAAASFNDSLTTLRFGLDAIKNQVAIGLAPELRALSEEFINLLIKNKEFIKDGLSITVGLLFDLTKEITRLIPAIGLAIGAWVAWRLVMLPVAATLGFLVSPLMLTAAALGLVVLVIDDLLVALNGGNSIIADFFSSFFGIDLQPILQDTLEWVKAFAVSVGAVIKSLITGSRQDIIDSTADLGKLLEPVAKKALILLGEIFSGIGGIIVDSIIGAFQSIPGLIKELDLLGQIGNLVGFVDEKLTASALQDLPIYNPNQSAQTNTNTIQQNVEINVSADTPQEITTAIRDGLQEQLTDAQVQFAVGGV